MALNTVSSDRLSTNVKTSNLGTELKKKVGQAKNLVVNGAMVVAQRGTSSTASGYGSIDRINQQFGGTDEAPTFAQVDVASGTTPYTNGFRKALKITNGNQTSGAGASDHIYAQTILEAQDIANSGWNYTSSSSYITISYWVKSSVAQNFYGLITSADGTAQAYVWETGSLTADTWTKITKTIPGNSNLQFDNDNGAGMYIAPIRAFDGTDRTGSMSLNAWAAYSSSARTPDQTSTWYTTNDATLEITGLQLELGQTATDFEHRSFHDERQRCYRYFQRYATGDGKPIGNGFYYNSTQVKINCNLLTTMRTTPTMAHITGTHYYVIYRDGAADTFNNLILEPSSDQNRCGLYNYEHVSGTAGQTGIVRCNNAAPSGGQVDFSAEL